MSLVVTAVLWWALTTLLACGLLVLVIAVQGAQRHVRRLGGRSTFPRPGRTALR